MSSAERTLQVLSTVGRAYREVSLGELASALGWPKSSVLRYASTLVIDGFLVRNGEGHYGLGPASWRLQDKRNYATYLTEACQPGLDMVAEATGETAVLSELTGRCTTALTIAAGSRTPRPPVPVTPVPVHASAFGWVLIAWLPPGQRALAVPTSLEPLTSSTIRSRATLERELATVCAQGFAAEWGHADPRQATVAAPVFSYSKVALSLGVLIPRSRLSAARAASLGRVLCDAADQAATHLGVPRHAPPYATAWSLADPSGATT
ncbi:IclR family transcriptional regulator [Propionibacteriaceae bacterium Y2011]